ncbi:MAG TPA: hypothetical protein DCZ92_07070 [Elusimicrobia bacterium]|nr:MAG: hypothetical protein A2016_04895 [Elusimicrobia bacterium GWF2_62_30]HBA60567.1 hypothetical protein [Elusimicrobiota bacterium]
MRSLTGSSLFVLILTFSCCPPARAGEPAGSAAPAETAVSSAAVPGPVPDNGRLTLNISKNSNYSRVGLDYSLKWDFSDLGSFRPGLKTISSGLRVLSSWDITENTRVNYYGLKTNPWRMIIGVSDAVGGNAPPAAGGSAVLSDTAPRKRLRLSISPLVDDVKQSIDDGLRDFLLKESMKGASPQWQKVSAEGKREFMRDVLSLGIWDTALPAMREGKAGLEYLSEKPVR